MKHHYSSRGYSAVFPADWGHKSFPGSLHLTPLSSYPTVRLAVLG